MGLFSNLFSKKQTVNNAFTENVCIVTANNNSLNRTSYERLRKQFIAIDTETTGLSCNSGDRVIELGAVRFVDMKPVAYFNSLIQIPFSVPKQAQAVNHITDEMLRNEGKSFFAAYKEFCQFISDALCGDTLLVAHNATFDMNFLKKELSTFGVNGSLQYIDTLSISRKLLKDLPSHKQDAVANYFHVQNSASHRATSDAETCGYILCELTKLYEKELVKEEQKKEKAKLTDEETETCAILLNILMLSGVDVSNIRFYKNSSNYVDVLDVYEYFRFKYTKKGSYIILAKHLVNQYLNNISLRTEECTKTESFDNIRVYFDEPFELEQLKDLLVHIINSKQHDAYYLTSVNRYRTEFLANSNNIKIDTTFIPQYIISARNRIEKKKKLEQEENLRKEKVDNEKQLALHEKEEKKRLNTEKQIDIDKAKAILESVVETFDKESIKQIADAAETLGKRAVVKLNDDNHILFVYGSVAEASNDVGISPKTIRDVCNGKYKHGGGFRWIYADEFLS